MQRKQIIELLQQHQHELKHYGVRTVAIFGSAARDEIGPTSDVDVLVEFAGPTTFDQYRVFGNSRGASHIYTN